MKDQIGEIVADLYKETLIYATSENASKVNLQAYIDKLEALGAQAPMELADSDMQTLLHELLFADSNGQDLTNAYNQWLAERSGG